MPELPEVETVKNTLKKLVCNKVIKNVSIYYDNIIEYPHSKEFKEQIKNERINDIKRRGKWLIFELDNYYLLSHLRMEGKYFIKDSKDERDKHEHVIFHLDDGSDLRYRDTRKFGKMLLVEKDKLETTKSIIELGYEPWDKKLTKDYLHEVLKRKSIPIKSSLLNQSIIAGIGNIYADEILFLSKINPETKSNMVSKDKCQEIIDNTKMVLESAIEGGGTTIRSYESSEGVHGRFQQKLLVHAKEKEKCSICGTIIEKKFVGGRGTYFCKVCQK
jgi:formamidopyrimidine-DNA glycosylase (fpg)